MKSRNESHVSRVLHRFLAADFSQLGSQPQLSTEKSRPKFCRSFGNLYDVLRKQFNSARLLVDRQNFKEDFYLFNFMINPLAHFLSHLKKLYN